MEKIKFIADTASDITDDDLARYHIDLPSVPITVDGKGYFERRDFGIREFYRVLGSASEIPTTSRVPADDYLGCYKRAYEEGYTDIISVTINAGGSGTNASAHMGAELLYRECPEAKEKLRIHVVDSRTYSVAYGYPVVEAAKMAEGGSGVQEILAYLDDWFRTVEIYLGCYSLEYAKRSGRIGAAAAFVGDVLGLRPVIEMIDGGTKIIDKVRGEKQVVARLVRAFRENCDDFTAPVLIIAAEEEEHALDLQEALKKECGVEGSVYYAGASIVINSGPRIAAVVCRGKKRPVPPKAD